MEVPPPIRKLARLLRKVVGIILILLGIVGLFLPILQGILFLFLGAAFLGIEKSRLMRWKAAGLNRWQGLKSWLKRRGHRISCWVLLCLALNSCSGFQISGMEILPDPLEMAVEGELAGVSDNGGTVESAVKQTNLVKRPTVKASAGVRVRVGTQ